VNLSIQKSESIQASIHAYRSWVQINVPKRQRASSRNKSCVEAKRTPHRSPACAAPESDSQNAHRSSPHGIGMDRASDSTIKRLNPQVLSKTKHKKQESCHASHANPLLLTALDTHSPRSHWPSLTLHLSPVRSNPPCRRRRGRRAEKCSSSSSSMDYRVSATAISVAASSSRVFLQTWKAVTCLLML
jgi:hypothetical protein